MNAASCEYESVFTAVRLLCVVGYFYVSSRLTAPHKSHNVDDHGDMRDNYNMSNIVHLFCSDSKVFTLN